MVGVFVSAPGQVPFFFAIPGGQPFCKFRIKRSHDSILEKGGEAFKVYDVEGRQEDSCFPIKTREELPV